MIYKIVAILLMTTVLFANNNSQNIVTTKIIGKQLENDKSHNSSYYKFNKFELKPSYSDTLQFPIKGYMQNRINRIETLLNKNPQTQKKVKATSASKTTQSKKVYHLGIGKSVFMTPDEFQEYLTKNY